MGSPRRRSSGEFFFSITVFLVSALTPFPFPVFLTVKILATASLLSLSVKPTSPASFPSGPPRQGRISPGFAFLLFPNHLQHCLWGSKPTRNSGLSLRSQATVLPSPLSFLFNFKPVSFEQLHRRFRLDADCAPEELLSLQLPPGFSPSFSALTEILLYTSLPA